MPYEKENCEADKDELKLFVGQHTESVIFNYEVDGEVCDVYVPEFKAAWTLCNLYNEGSFFHPGKDFHKIKRDKFERAGIRLYQIFSDEWLQKKDIIKSIIEAKLNIYERTYFARKLICKVPNKAEERAFINANHSQGAVGCNKALGLFTPEGELLSLMTFGIPRYNKNYNFELIRFLNKRKVKVIGGASKIFKNFVKDYNIPNMISYCDLRLFDGGLYEMLGFTKEPDSAPNYYYVVEGKRCSRVQFQKHKLEKQFPDIFLDSKTEKAIMAEAGIPYVYDCGMGRYTFQNENYVEGTK